LFSDGEKIERIILNLLSNAVKYTSRGKIVWGIGFNKSKKIFQIRVQDSGIGMSEEEIKKIFAAFSRVDSFQKSKISGTGLGLAITKRFVDLLGGKIEVQSKQGKGTIFQVKIPVKDFSDSIASVKSAKNGKAHHASEKKPTKGQNAGTVLIVDDNPDNQYAVEYILSSRGYRAFFAADGKQGIKMAQKIMPDVILMDMFMPKMDGYEATQKIRGMKKLSSVPIIAMTAKTREEDENRALKSGCNDYLSKPFTTEQVIQTIEKWIGKKNG
jgi:CheY-like chemotaxis protein/anti-sigma regulatory factor (Ser/Thr protein kinase)